MSKAFAPGTQVRTTRPAIWGGRKYPAGTEFEVEQFVPVFDPREDEYPYDVYYLRSAQESVVLKASEVEAAPPMTMVEVVPGRYPFRPVCSCGHPFRGYVSRHAAEDLAEAHRKEHTR
jgi:hypothetical protein